jgi:hypothetical protein
MRESLAARCELCSGSATWQKCYNQWQRNVSDLRALAAFNAYAQVDFDCFPLESPSPALVIALTAGCFVVVSPIKEGKNLLTWRFPFRRFEMPRKEGEKL